MKLRIVFILSLISTAALAQPIDSMRTQVLQEVVVEGVSTEDDTLQNFYKSNPAATTENILSRMKGVSLIRRGALGQEPVIRGLSNGQLNVTIDGMKLFSACTDRMDPVTIYVEPANLSTIQTLFGPQGSEFGSTIGGSLNMKLAQANVGKNSTTGMSSLNVQSSAPSLNFSSFVNVSHHTSGDRASLVFRKAGNYREGGGASVPYSQYQKINLSLNGKWALAAHDTLSADVLLDKGTHIGFPALTMDVGEAQAGIYSLTYRHVAPWFIFHKVKIKAYHNAISHSMDDTKRPDVTMHMDMPGLSRTTGLLLDTDVHLFHQHQTIVKLEYFRNNLVGEMTMYPSDGEPMYMQTAPASVRQNAGIFVSQQYRINPMNVLQFNVRADYFHDRIEDGIGANQLSVLYNDLAPAKTRLLKSLNVNYRRNISQSLMLEVNAGYGERMPTLNERLGFYLYNRFDGYDYIGNPDINPESTFNTELTMNYVLPRVEMQATVFYQSVEDYITGITDPSMKAMTIGARGVKTYANFNHAELAGGELMVLAKPESHLQWINTIKYTYGQLSGYGALPLIPPLKAVSALRYQAKTFDIQAEWEQALDQHHVSSIVGEQPTSAYAIFNLRSGIRINSRFSMNGGIENVLDRRYREHLDWGNIMRPGRNFYLNLNFNF